MNIKVNQNVDGIIEFIKVFKSSKVLKKDHIEKLFNTKSYQKLVELFGGNIGLTEKEQWVDIFYEAYNLYLKSSSYSGEDILKKNIIEPVIWAINNIDELELILNRVLNIIDKKEYLRKAFAYLPSISVDIEININYYIFMYNACVEANEVLIDLAFANLLNEDHLNDLLAHEMHHYLKGYANLYEYPNSKFNDVTRTLFSLENEGTADMCSFESLNHIYEKFGWMQEGVLKNILDNSYDYFIQFNNLLRKKLIDNNDTISLYNFIMNNQMVHPLGYKMATYIKNNLGIEVLKKCIGKPLTFILNFKLAYKMSTNENVFDNEIIEKIKLIYQ